jgi:hypothetical protein
MLVPKFVPKIEAVPRKVSITEGYGKISIPTGKLSPADAERKGIFYLLWTENGGKREQPIEPRRFEAVVKAAKTKERHLRIWRMASIVQTR